MKTFRSILVIIISISFLGCKKEVNINGNFIITVLYNGQAVVNPTVYLKAGAVINPGIPLSQYDKIGNGNASGLVVFTDIAPNSYYMYAEGSVNSIPVKGEFSVKYEYVEKASRRELKIHTE